MRERICMAVVMLCLAFAGAYSQTAPGAGTARRTTVYESYQPAVITLADGRVISEKRANIFLKNSSLVYRRGTTDMEADISRISTVQFSDRLYVRVDSLLAYVVDTVGPNRLLRATVVDMEAYRGQLAGNQQITNLELGYHVNVTSMALSPDDDRTYPLMDYYFFDFGGQVVKVHERTVLRKAGKEKRRALKTLVRMPDFSWNDAASLLKLLELMS